MSGLAESTGQGVTASTTLSVMVMFMTSESLARGDSRWAGPIGTMYVVRDHADAVLTCVVQTR